MVSKSMLNSLLQKQLSYTPEEHRFYMFKNDIWQPSTSTPSHAPTSSANLATQLQIITWNIDFMTPQPCERMASALRYLEDLVSQTPSSTATVILLQEMMESQNFSAQDAKDLSQIANAAWVQEKFHITDINTDQWESPYGVVTLVDRRLAIDKVCRLRFVSEFQRHAVLVDIRIAAEPKKVLRLCNVHLDSSYGSLRPVQWKGAAKHLQDSEAGVAASILAGDCNANQPRDKTEPQDNGFKDAYLELGGTEGDEEGATWGFQSLGWERWGRQRLDKEVFWGSLKVKSLQRIGKGVQVDDELAKRGLEEDGELPYVTDHYGLLGEYEIEGGLSMVSHNVITE